MTNQINDGAWFLPKRFGYGSGLPIAWQGWVMLALHGSLVAAGMPLLDLANHAAMPSGRHHLEFLLYALAVTAVFVPLYAAKTRGGWKWRWPGRN